jgi:hypothetical protein
MFSADNVCQGGQFADIATTEETSFLLCKLSTDGTGVKGSSQLFGFGKNLANPPYSWLVKPDDITANVLTPTPITTIGQELDSISCGYKSCFAVQKNDTRLFYSWYYFFFNKKKGLQCFFKFVFHKLGCG